MPTIYRVFVDGEEKKVVHERDGYQATAIVLVECFKAFRGMSHKDAVRTYSKATKGVGNGTFGIDGEIDIFEIGDGDASDPDLFIADDMPYMCDVQHYWAATGRYAENATEEQKAFRSSGNNYSPNPDIKMEITGVPDNTFDWRVVHEGKVYASGAAPDIGHAGGLANEYAVALTGALNGLPRRAVMATLLFGRKKREEAIHEGRWPNRPESDTIAV